MKSKLGFTGRLAEMCGGHPWWTLGFWVVLVAVAFGLSGLMNVVAETATVGTEATRAANLIESRLREETAPEEFVVIEAPASIAAGDSFDSFVQSLVDELRGLEEVASAVSYLDDAPSLLSRDGSVALVPVTLIGDEEDSAETAEPVVDLVKAVDGTEGFRVTTVGFGSVNIEVNHLMEETLAQGELLGVSVALIVLIIVFGAVVAALLPIPIAFLAIFLAVGATAVVSNTMEMSSFVVFIITMIGLAVGIDYTLFIVQRFREERASGKARTEAISASGATASRTVFFSGMAVVIALAGMLIMPDPTFRSFAVGAMFVVAAAVLAALTLLPAILSLLGDRVNWLTLPFVGSRTESESAGGFWDWITRMVTKRPVISIVLTAGILIALTLPVLNLNLGGIGISILPEDSNERHAFDVLNAEFSAGVLYADIVIDAPDVGDASIATAVDSLTAAIQADVFFGQLNFEVNAEGDLALLAAVMPGDFSSDDSKDALSRLRNDYIPAAFGGTGAKVSVGGATAETVDSVQTQKDYLPYVFAFVLGFSFLLLLMVFRSIVVPLKAVVMNLLSVGAAYGALVLVFQEGIGAELLGFRESPVIQSWLPLFLFAILFGLSMDYHVFLLSRIKERYDQTGDNNASVAFGLRRTAGMITGAALIMVAVFGGMTSGELVTFQQVGFGLAFAVFLDATIIRCILVPASMELLGDKNWYFPSWLEWLPKIHIEGAEVPAAAPAAFRDDAGS